MSKKIFISHASADERIVSMFVDNILCHGCGVKEEDIVYTSRADSGVINGDDIPVAIKDGIRESIIFFMMVSENYRKSEVCLNEMGAAWMNDVLLKKIILLPGVSFDSIGWLMSMKQATSISDEQGLDAIHDEVCDAVSTKIQTATWNRNRKRFLEEIDRLDNSLEVGANVTNTVADDNSIDLLEHSDSFEFHMRQYTEILALFSSETIHFNEEIEKSVSRMASLSNNPSAITSKSVRAIMVAIARETDRLSVIYEHNTSSLRDHYEQAMVSAIELQKSNLYSDEVKESNRLSVMNMVNTMRGTRKTLLDTRSSMDEVPDLDKTFRQAKRRFQKALEEMIKVVDFCIQKGNEFQLI